MRRSASAALLCAAIGLLSLALASPASAARNIKLGFADDELADKLLFSSVTSFREMWAQRMGETNAEVVRLNVYWRTISGNAKPANPADPDDPGYDFEPLDRAVRAARANGLEILFTVLSAPDFAESAGRPNSVRPGTWKPQADDFELFAKALATRYSGTHPDPLGGILPQVRSYEGWNEPNLQLYINPQRKGKKNKAPKIYRDLLNGFYDGIKSVNPGFEVFAAGTSPFGDPTGNRRIPPVEFWRDVLCLKEKKGKLKFDAAACPAKAKRAHFDVFTHNSINAPGDGPRVKASDPDNATASDMHKLVDLIRAAEKHQSVQPNRSKREVWSTELWFESSPPERKSKAVNLVTQARYVAEALYILWKQKVAAGIFLQLRDSPFSPGGPAVVGLQSGVYFHDGSEKPSLGAARFPFYSERKNKKKVVVWGKAPAGGKLTVEAKDGGWKKLTSFGVKGGQVFKKNVKYTGKTKIRATLGATTTINWPIAKK